MKTREKQSIVAAGKAISIASNVVTVLSWLGITFSSLLAFAKANCWYIIPVVIFIALLFCVSWCKKNQNALIRRAMNMFAYDMKYSFEEWTAKYEYHTDTQMSFYTTYLVKAMQAGVDHIRVRFNWSGATEKNPIKPEAISDGDYCSKNLEFFEREYGYNHYKLYSKKVINKNDEPIKLGVKIENLQDSAKIASPHLLTSISVVTKKLNMIVILPYHISPDNVRCVEYLHATDDCHWNDLSDKCTTQRDGDKWLVSVSIDKPVLGGKYILSWEPTVHTTNNIP